MTLLAWPALLLLIAAGVLLALATLGAGPRRRDVGTLMIWQRVADKRPPTRRRRRNYDLLLWLLLAAVLVGALSAARPAFLPPAPRAQVAVFIERLMPGDFEPLLNEAMARARESVPDCDLTFYTADADALGRDDLRPLRDGPIRAQVAQFVAASAGADGRVLMLCAPLPHADEAGLVLPRVTDRQPALTFDIQARDDRLILRRSKDGALRVEGATVLDSVSSGRETVWVLHPESETVVVPVGYGREAQLHRRPFVVGVGAQWDTRAHRALYAALGADVPSGETAAVWLGGELTPGVRINLGRSADLSGAELSYDPQHSLFRELPFADYDWMGQGRVMALEAGTRPLMRALVEGEPIGDVIRLRGDSVEFAGDPFTDAPVASAALLLDNAIGVVTGERPSERQRYETFADNPLPTRRAALATPFEATGKLEPTPRETERREVATWLSLLAGLLLIAAGTLSARRCGVAFPAGE